MSEFDFYESWFPMHMGYDEEGSKYEYFKTNRAIQDTLGGSTANFWDAVNKGLIKRYEGPREYKSYLDSISTNVPGTPIVPTYAEGGLAHMLGE